MQKAFILLFLFLYHPCDAQLLDSKNKLAVVAYLLNGVESTSHYLPPSPIRKGQFYLDFHCRKGFFDPKSDTAFRVFEYIASMLLVYVVADSAKYYDSSAVRFIGVGSSPPKTWIFAPGEVPRPQPTFDQRFKALLGLLPFRTAGTYNDDSIEIVLHTVPGYSPSDHLHLYVAYVGLLIYDFVLEQKKRQIVLSVYDDEQGAVFRYYPTMKLFRKIIKMMNK